MADLFREDAIDARADGDNIHYPHIAQVRFGGDIALQPRAEWLTQQVAKDSEHQRDRDQQESPTQGASSLKRCPGKGRRDKRGGSKVGPTTGVDGKSAFTRAQAGHRFIDPQTGEATMLEPPTVGQGARRVWSDSQERIWVSEWNAGQVALYDPADNSWREWKLPGNRPQTYAVYVDDQDMVWLSDFDSNSLVRFNPNDETFTVYELPSPDAAVRQILGRPGEIWGAESGADKLVVIRTNSQ